ncbi:PepSY domain-containing protein [bacterium]|nr:PepSY domain-containing protein [bacterium]MBU1071957.1 PepSY domain-containing protein [bacterium]MBU1675467.1 PepSY domain-containing protein [bacterium]
MYKFFRDAHKWTGIVLGVVILNIAATGFLLLIKKDHAWLQPPTQTGAAGGVEAFITTQDLFAAVFAQDHPGFRTLDDIDRVDFRPGKRVFKVRSGHGHGEIQVDAVTGAVLSVATRRSDLIEDLHDGSFYGEWAHGWLMPAASAALLLLLCSGLYIWLQPKSRQSRRRRLAAQGDGLRTR